MNGHEPAFPSACTNDTLDVKQGISLRYYLAAKAMQGLLSGEHFSLPSGVLAGMAFDMADEMIKRGEGK